VSALAGCWPHTQHIMIAALTKHQFFIAPPKQPICTADSTRRQSSFRSTEHLDNHASLPVSIENKGDKRGRNLAEL
jgi:hypothetical protein